MLLKRGNTKVSVEDFTKSRFATKYTLKVRPILLQCLFYSMWVADFADAKANDLKQQQTTDQTFFLRTEKTT